MPEAPVDDAVIGWQLYRVHAMLFVCAYLGLLGYFAVTDPHDPVAALFKPPAQEQNVSKLEDGSLQAPYGSEGPLSRPAIEGLLLPGDGSPQSPYGSEKPLTSQAIEADTEATVRQQERIRLSQIGSQATSAGAPQERAQAIDQLNVATPEALQALQAVVTSDSAVRNRIRALNSLRALAEQEDTKDAVISIVHLATTDTNASVASRAGELYRELTQEPAVEQ